MVYRYAGGVPRLINVLCDTALLCGFAEERKDIDEGLVKTAAEELQWLEYAARVREQEHHVESTGRFASPSGPLARIEVLFGDEFVSDLDLSPGRMIIGRTPDNDLQIRSKFISRHHAQIVTDSSQSVLEDLNSTNGVFIKSKRVKRHPLTDGDVIQLGEHKILYRDLRGARLVAADDLEDDESLDDDLDGHDDDDADVDDDAEQSDEEIDAALDAEDEDEALEEDER
jgi:hypothetical protein